MPINSIQRLFFSFVTVLITVHAFVFYSVYVVDGSNLIASTGASTVYEAVSAAGGLYMFGSIVPVWTVILIELICALLMAVFIGSPLSFKIASKLVDPKTIHPFIYEIVVIASTVLVMCPSMSFLAALFYYPYDSIGFTIPVLFGNWFRLICYNFPFALLSQVFVIQPLVRAIFRTVFRKDIEARQHAQFPVTQS